MATLGLGGYRLLCGGRNCRGRRRICRGVRNSRCTSRVRLWEAGGVIFGFFFEKNFFFRFWIFYSISFYMCQIIYSSSPHTSPPKNYPKKHTKIYTAKNSAHYELYVSSNEPSSHKLNYCQILVNQILPRRLFYLALLNQ